MLLFAAAGFLFVVFLISVAYDRRLVRNGVYLFFALALLIIGLLFTLADTSEAGESVAAYLVFAGLILIPLLILVLGVFLIANGVTMLRREGKRPANLLSLAAGVGIFGFIALGILAGGTGSYPLGIVVGAIGTVLGYVALLFVCFLLYSLFYGTIRPRRGADFIVVLGSGLAGTRVPPLLASRLDRARAVFDAERAAGRHPLLIASGGQGPGEDVPESHAMADYLISRDVPEECVLIEDRSRSTEENLRFSADIMRQQVPKYRSLVVTNNYHVMRAARTARKEKVNAQVIGAPTARYFWPSATIREFVAIFLSHRVINLGMCALLAAGAVLPAL